MSRKRRRRAGSPAPLVLAIALLAACGGQDRAGSGSSGPRLVLLYAPCTVNRNFLSPYAAGVDYTPQLGAFAEDAAVFERHQTEAGQSGVAFASLFTGSQADHHGVYRHPLRLPDEDYLIAEAFAEHGYETFFWSDHRMASPELNYGQGVASEHTFTEARVRGRWLPSGVRGLLVGLLGGPAHGRLTADDPAFLRILERLRTDPDYRAFVLTNFTVTHGKYRRGPVEPFLEAHPDRDPGLSPEAFSRYDRLYRDHYYGLSWNFPETVRRLELGPEAIGELARTIEVLYASNVWELDRLFGAVVERIDEAGLGPQSVIAFTADHGEVLYRENAPFKWSHALQLAPEVLTVPWILRAPGVAPQRYTAVTRSIDVFPTLAGLAGIGLGPDSGVQGVDLSAALRGEAAAPELVAYSHTTVLARSVFEQMHSAEHRDQWSLARRLFPDEGAQWIWAARRDGDMVYKLHRPDGDGWRVSAYDLASDPTETRDLFDADNPRHAAAAADLAAYKAHLVERYAEGKPRERERLLGEEDEAEALRALGYIQ